MLPWFDPMLAEASELVAPFWAAFESDEIALPRCSVCRRFQWYPDATGPDCAGASYDWVPVALTGTVYTITRVHKAFLPGGDDTVPFSVGFVELDGVPGVRLVANFVTAEPPVAIGDRVVAEFVAVHGVRRPVFRLAAA